MTDWDKLKLTEGRVVTDGEPIVLELEKHDIWMPQICCDCHKVHNVLFQLKGKTLMMRWYSDSETTDMVREGLDDAATKVVGHEKVVASFVRHQDALNEQLELFRGGE